MSDNSNPKGTDLNTAQSAISAMFAPQEDTAEQPVALEAEEAQEPANAEMPEEEAETQEFEAEDEGDLEVDDEDEEQDDQSLDILSAKVTVDGEEITVEELRRGHLRQRDYTRKTQELAEARKTVEAFAAEIQQKDAQYAELLPILRAKVQQTMEQEPDWDKLYDTDPATAAKAERQFRKQQQERQQQLEAIVQEEQRLKYEQQVQTSRQLEVYTEQQRQVLPDIIPEWRDTSTAKKEASELREFLMSEGFSEDDVSGLRNATLVKLARKAMLYDRGQTRATAAKVQSKAQKPKTLKSGSRGSQPKPKSAQKEALQRVKSTGNVKDAAAAIKSLL